MTKREKLLKDVKDLGYKLEGSETVKELKEIKKGLEKGAGNSGGNGNAGNETKKSGKIYLWLKTRAYVSDEKRIDPGLYCMAKGEMYPRLEKANATVREIFEDKIPSRKLTEIARHCGVDSDKYDKDEDLLIVLLTQGIREF